MKKISLFILSLLISGTITAKPAHQSLDQIIAIVNDDVVTRSELAHAIMLTKLQQNQPGIPSLPENQLKKQTVEQLINNKLQLQAARQSGVAISDQELDSVIRRIAEQNNMPVSELYQHINQDGMTTDEYRQEMRDQLTIQKLQRQEIASKISITPDEVNTYARAKMHQSSAPNEYRLEDILIPLTDTPTPADIAAAKQQAMRILSRLQHGEPSHTAAAAQAGDKNAAQVTDLGWRKLAEIPSAFTSQVMHLRVNKAAGPIQAANGFHVVRLTALRSTGTKQLPDRKQIEDLLMQHKFEEASQTWLSKLRSQAFIQLNMS